MPILSWLLLELLALPMSAQSAEQSPNYARVDAAVQRERDATRLEILQDESARETRELKAAQAEARDTPHAADVDKRIALHQQNLAALAREIASAEHSAKASMAAPRPQQDDWLIRNERSVETNAAPSSALPITPSWVIPSPTRSTP